MTRRQVRVTEQFFDRLDELFPVNRSPQGAPSGTDFLLHEMPNVIDALAVDFEGSTMSTRSDPDVHVLIAAGLLVPFSRFTQPSSMRTGSRSSTWTSTDLLERGSN